MVGIPTIGLFLLASVFYNRSSAVVARALASRGRQANPVLTYETALRRFFAYGGVLRRWRNPMMMADDGAIRWMADDVRGNRRRWGSGVPPARRGWCRGESRHATLRFAYRVTEECRRSATRECKPRDDVYTTALRRFFAYGDGASCRNEVFVMRLFCVGFCKIGK